VQQLHQQASEVQDQSELEYVLLLYLEWLVAENLAWFSQLVLERLEGRRLRMVARTPEKQCSFWTGEEIRSLANKD